MSSGSSQLSCKNFHKIWKWDWFNLIILDSTNELALKNQGLIRFSKPKDLVELEFEMFLKYLNLKILKTDQKRDQLKKSFRRFCAYQLKKANVCETMDEGKKLFDGLLKFYFKVLFYS